MNLSFTTFRPHIILPVCAGILCVFPLAAQQSELPHYAPIHQVAGVIHVCGSPQMGELLKFYEQGFHQVQPSVRFVDDLQSTLTAVSGVYIGHAEIGLLGREIWPAEVDAFQSAEGHPPLVIKVATGSFDVPKATFALMIFVPKENPIGSLSMEQLEEVFADTQGAKHAATWGDLGLRGDWASRPIHLYGFAIDNDKSQIFARLVFKHGGPWKKSLHESSNSANGNDAGQLIVNAVASDPNAIGISNIHYATAGVKPLAISTAAHHAPIEPTRENVASTAYPLTRAIYIVMNTNAAHLLNKATREFLHFVLSREGKTAVEKEGNYLPLIPAIAASQRRALDFSTNKKQRAPFRD